MGIPSGNATPVSNFCMPMHSWQTYIEVFETFDTRHEFNNYEQNKIV